MSQSRKNAFTLLELLTVLALIGLLAGITVSFSESLLAGVGDEPLRETLRRAVREARFQAASTGQTVQLTWDAEARRFDIVGADGATLVQLQSDADEREDSLKLEQVLPGRGPELPPDRPELEEVTQLVFAPDRSSTPFIAEVRYGGKTSRMRYDAFSNLTMEEER